MPATASKPKPKSKTIVNKFHHGNIADKNDFGGWFIGSFLDENHPCHTKNVEVLYVEHEKGWRQPAHFHRQKIEITIILQGKARYRINGQEFLLNSGDYFFADIDHVIEGEFLADSKVLAIHSPSIVDDKVLVVENKGAK